MSALAGPARSVVVDTDGGSDDAVALILAALTPGVELRACTVVAGNVDVDQAVRNVLVTLELVGRGDVEVHRGLARPLVRSLETARDVHGQDGMSGVRFPDPAAGPSPEHAVDALRRIARTEPGRHTLVTLGPLGNVAAALLLEPDLLTRFRHTYLMLGAPDARGNRTPTAEYNAWVDPEAAALVLDAPGPVTMVGWDVSRRFAVLTPDDDARLRAVGPHGRVASEINRAVVEAVGMDGGYDLPDPVTMAVALDPGLVLTAHRRTVAVSTDPSTRGQTSVDHRRRAAAPNVTVVEEVDRTGFVSTLLTRLAEG